MVITAQPGDTLSLLACRYRTTVTVLQELNNLGTSTTIKAGEQLVVPDPKNGPAACR
jgi:LysM repeat protein